MGPTISGNFSANQCSNCDHTFRFDRLNVPKSNRIVCPNCGRTQSASTESFQDTVHLEEIAEWPVARWSVIAFGNVNTESFSIKRVLGLPNESIEFRNGNVFANGKIVRKSLQTQKEIAIPVFTATNDQIVRDRFRVNGTDSKWKIEGRKLKYESATEEKNEIDWITYQHQLCYMNAGIFKPPILDDFYGYNQNLARRTNPVSELLITFDIRFDDKTKFSISLRDGFQRHQLDFDFGLRKCRLAGRVIDVPAKFVSNETIKVTLSTIDDRLWLLFNGETLFEKRLNYRKRNASHQEDLFKLGARKGKLSIQNIAIKRDIYYYSDYRDQLWKLDSNQYFVVGDNVPVSRDSRHWNEFGIDRKYIIGIATPAKIQPNP